MTLWPLSTVVGWTAHRMSLRHEPVGGARVLIGINGVSLKFSLGDGPSVLVNHLLTGFADRPTQYPQVV